MVAQPRLVASGISKNFGINQALDDVDLTISRGEVHALIGQNGCGKSTLTRVLTGFYPADAGSVHVDGERLRNPVKWSKARSAGAMIVHQSLGIIERLSVADNILLGDSEPHLFRRTPRKQREELVERLLALVRSDIPPSTLAGSLNATQRSAIAVARALRSYQPGQGFLILDETTRSMVGPELVQFHETMRELVDEGTSVLLVSHNLEEVKLYADRVTVLRDGRAVAEGASVDELSEKDLVELTLGKSQATMARRTPSGRFRDAASYEIDVRRPGKPDLEFSVREGEILGITGVAGSGYEVIPGAIAGSSAQATTTIRHGGETIVGARDGVSERIRGGIAMVPEKREAEGLDTTQTITANVALPSMKRRGRPWFVGRRWQARVSQDVIERFSVRTSGPDQLVSHLSGGNQQKILVGKWLMTDPKLLVLHEPTQAVDIQARQDILAAAAEAAADGVAVIVVTVETADLEALADRVLIVREGGIDMAIDHSSEALLAELYGAAEAAEERESLKAGMK